MKKLILSLMLSVVMIGTAYAGSHMISGATTTTVSLTHHLTEGEAVHTYACSFLNSTSITAFTVVLQGSIDDKVTWSDLSTLAYDATDITNKFGMRHVTNKPVDDTRLNITVVTGSDLDADCYYSPGR